MLIPLESLTPNEGVVSVYEFRISSEAFAWPTIKKAAYRFSGRCSFDFQSEGKEIICKLFFPCAQSPKIAASIELAFRNELLDQDLRERIAEETAPLRNAILAYAFSKTGIQSPDEI
jgi:His-Xaa-Ser system protein HxsD